MIAASAQELPVQERRATTDTVVEVGQSTFELTNYLKLSPGYSVILTSAQELPVPDLHTTTDAVVEVGQSMLSNTSFSYCSL